MFVTMKQEDRATLLGFEEAAAAVPNILQAYRLFGDPDFLLRVRTTDLARIDADGFLWILGRADQAIIRGGFKVMPEDVRAALESHPDVQGASVVGRPDERLGEVPVALVERRPGRAVTAEELADHLRTRLSGYEVPAQVVFVDQMPRTPSGKPDLRAVREHFTEHAH